MNEFWDALEQPKEVQEAASDPSLENTLKEIGRTTELSAGEESWLEALFHRIMEPIIDVFDHSEEGYDTERISPARAGEEASEGVEGHDIEEAAEEWHVQEGENSCAVCTQQFIINEFMDLDMTEEQLCTIAAAKGWFDAEMGTSVSNVGNLLELFGIDTHTNYEGSISDIKNTLDQGGRVIVAVDSMVLWTDGFGNYPIYGMDHAIEVIGIDDSNPLDVRVIINDSGVENGCGRSVSYLEFMEAWNPSGGFMVSAFPRY